MMWPAISKNNKKAIRVGLGWQPGWYPPYKIMNVMGAAPTLLALAPAVVDAAPAGRETKNLGRAEELGGGEPSFYTREFDSVWHVVMECEHVMRIYESLELYTHTHVPPCKIHHLKECILHGGGRGVGACAYIVGNRFRTIVKSSPWRSSAGEYTQGRCLCKGDAKIGPDRSSRPY